MSRHKIDSLVEQMDAQARAREDTRKHEAIRPILAEMTVSSVELPDSRALSALLRSSLAAGGDAPEARYTVKVATVGFNLERDGCDYVHMALRFLEKYKCPQECRLFVLAVCALSGGDAESLHLIPDVKIAELLGYERHAIKPMREALIEWERETNYAFIDIVEGDLNRSKMRYTPTQYRARVVTVIGRYVRHARSMNLRSPQAALQLAAGDSTSEDFDEHVADVPTAPLVRRREHSFGNGNGKPQTQAKGSYAERQIELAYSALDRHRKGLESVWGDAIMAGQNPWPMLEKFVEEMTGDLEKLTEKYPKFQRSW